MSGIYEMKEKENIKDQLITEVIEMRRKIIDFETIEIKHKRIEEDYRCRLNFEKTVSAVLSRFVGIYDIDHVINASLADIGKLCNTNRAYLCLFNNNKTTMSNTHEWCAKGISPQIENLKDIPTDMFPWWMKKLLNEEVIHIKDVSKLPVEAKSEKEILESQDIKSLLVFPLSVGGELAGFIGFDNVIRTGKWSNEDIKFLSIFSKVLGNSFKGKRVEKELQRVRDELELKVKERTAELTALNEKLQRDITERKRVEEELRDSEQRSRILFEYAPDAYYLNDLKGNFVDGNRAAEKLVGYKRIELIGKNFFKLKLLSPTEIPRAAKALAKNIMGLSTGPDEFVLNRKDNRKVIVEVSTYPVKIESKTLVLGIARDITERKRADEALRESEEKFRAISTSAQDAIIIVDNEGKISYWNKAAERIFGYSKEESMGKDMQNTIIPQKYLVNFKKGFDIFKSTGKGPILGKIMELTSLKKDGTEFPIEMSISSVKMRGKWNGIGIIRDITERKRAEEKLKQSYQKLGETMDNIIIAIAKIVETRDPYTAGHQQRVSLLATSIAKEMGLSEDKVKGVEIASLIHDIGKINIPSEILSKPGKLTEEEFNLIKGHPKIGYDILKLIDFPWPVAEIVLQHHENINGSGYPRGLKDEKILLEAKIIGVADVVEAMSSHRPYRPALGINKALEEITQNKGILYDPKVVEACIRIFKKERFKFQLKHY